MLGKQFPVVEVMLQEAADDLLAFAAFPVGHWKKIWSTNQAGRAATSHHPVVSRAGRSHGRRLPPVWPPDRAVTSRGVV